MLGTGWDPYGRGHRREGARESYAFQRQKPKLHVREGKEKACFMKNPNKRGSIWGYCGGVFNLWAFNRGEDE